MKTKGARKRAPFFRALRASAWLHSGFTATDASAVSIMNVKLS